MEGVRPDLISDTVLEITMKVSFNVANLYICIYMTAFVV
jgi:hypothetical protein